MSFTVEPERLETCARALDELEAAATTARTYAAAHVDLAGASDAGVIFLNFVATTSGVEGAVTEALSRLREICSESAQEMRAAARYYRTTDAAEARRQDALLPAGPAGGGR